MYQTQFPQFVWSAMTDLPGRAPEPVLRSVPGWLNRCEMSLNDIQLHNDASSCLLVSADLLPLSFSSGVNNKQSPRRQAHAVNRLWLLMKSTRDDLMLLFLVGKSYYFNSHRICPLRQPHQLRTEEMLPFFTACLSCRCVIAPRTHGMADPVFVCASARQWNVTHLFKYCRESPLTQTSCPTNHAQGTVGWMLVVCNLADDKARHKQLAAGCMCESQMAQAMRTKITQKQDKWRKGSQTTLCQVIGPLGSTGHSLN